MFRKHGLFLLMLVAAMVGPSIYFNYQGDHWLPGRQELGTGFSATDLANLPIRNDRVIDLSPVPLARDVATIPVSALKPGNEVNPSRINSPFTLPAAPIGKSIILPGDEHGPYLNAIPLEFMPTTQLSEVFRFDINPNWVRGRWERVSLSTGEGGLTGLRVSLTTGVNTNDLYGSLTYFFDRQQILQKIGFRGWTGNPDSLIEFVVQNFQFKSQPTNSAGLYLAKSWAKTKGALYLQFASVIRAENPNQQIAVLLELNNPNSAYALSSDVSALIFDTAR